MAVMAVFMVMLSNTTTHYLTYRPIHFKHVDAALPIYIIATNHIQNAHLQKWAERYNNDDDVDR